MYAAVQANNHCTCCKKMKTGIENYTEAESRNGDSLLRDEEKLISLTSIQLNVMQLQELFRKRYIIACRDFKGMLVPIAYCQSVTAILIPTNALFVEYPSSSYDLF
jgi:hypothetical protein